MGEVTSSSAIILLEVKFSNNTVSETQRRRVTIKCELFKKGDTEPFTDPLEKEFPSRSPQVRIWWRRCLLIITSYSKTFHFVDLDPDTEYVAIFHGINSEEAGKVFALFKTKKEEIDQFTILALSCDRPDRLLLGQTNPWYQVAAQTYNTDVILHLGDQVFINRRMWILIINVSRFTIRVKIMMPLVPCLGSQSFWMLQRIRRKVTWREEENCWLKSTDLHGIRRKLENHCSRVVIWWSGLTMMWLMILQSRNMKMENSFIQKLSYNVALRSTESTRDNCGSQN